MDGIEKLFAGFLNLPELASRHGEDVDRLLLADLVTVAVVGERGRDREHDREHLEAEHEDESREQVLRRHTTLGAVDHEDAHGQEGDTDDPGQETPERQLGREGQQATRDENDENPFEDEVRGAIHQRISGGESEVQRGDGGAGERVPASTAGTR